MFTSSQKRISYSVVALIVAVVFSHFAPAKIKVYGKIPDSQQVADGANTITSPY